MNKYIIWSLWKHTLLGGIETLMFKAHKKDNLKEKKNYLMQQLWFLRIINVLF